MIRLDQRPQYIQIHLHSRHQRRTNSWSSRWKWAQSPYCWSDEGWICCWIHPHLFPGAAGIYRCNRQWTFTHKCGKKSCSSLLPGIIWNPAFTLLIALLTYTQSINVAGIDLRECSIEGKLYLPACCSTAGDTLAGIYFQLPSVTCLVHW